MELGLVLVLEAEVVSADGQRVERVNVEEVVKVCKLEVVRDVEALKGQEVGVGGRSAVGLRISFWLSGHTAGRASVVKSVVFNDEYYIYLPS